MSLFLTSKEDNILVAKFQKDIIIETLPKFLFKSMERTLKKKFNFQNPLEEEP